MKKTDIDYHINEEIILNIKEDLLYNWELSIEQDIFKKYNIPLTIIREINYGKKYQNIGNYSYPIRGKNIRNKYNFSKETILLILNQLRNTNNSMLNIGKLYHLDRSTISRINTGKSYLIKGYNYPARKTIKEPVSTIS